MTYHQTNTDKTLEAWEVGKMIQRSPTCDHCQKRMRANATMYVVDQGMSFICSECKKKQSPRSGNA